MPRLQQRTDQTVQSLLARTRSQAIPQPLLRTLKTKGGIQVSIVFLLEFPVGFLHFSLKIIVKLLSGVDPGFSAA